MPWTENILTSFHMKICTNKEVKKKKWKLTWIGDIPMAGIVHHIVHHYHGRLCLLHFNHLENCSQFH